MKRNQDIAGFRKEKQRSYPNAPRSFGTLWHNPQAVNCSYGVVNRPMHTAVASLKPCDTVPSMVDRSVHRQGTAQLQAHALVSLCFLSKAFSEIWKLVLGYVGVDTFENNRQPTRK